MSIVNTSLKILTVSLVLVMIGCGDESLYTGAPGTGGTGPIGPPIMTASYVPLMATNYVKAQNDQDKMNMSAGKVHNPIPSNVPPVNNSVSDPDAKTTHQVRTISKSADAQYCQGFQRSITLIEEDKPVDQLTKKSDKPINIEVEVINVSGTNLNERQYSCTLFEVTDLDGKSIIDEPTTQCDKPIETIQYLPNTGHKYNVQLGNLNITGRYKVSFLNDVEDMEYPCPTFIEFLVE